MQIPHDWLRGPVWRFGQLALGSTAALVLFAGCDRSGLNLGSVEGVVTYKGAPLEKAGVLFKPEKGPMAFGTTDDQGHFRLSTANKDGALVGEHRVSISKTQQLSPQVAGERFPRYQTKFLIPEKYGSPETSELSATVKRGRNQLEFNLN
jgi:hypothetical protein